MNLLHSNNNKKMRILMVLLMSIRLPFTKDQKLKLKQIERRLDRKNKIQTQTRVIKKVEEAPTKRNNLNHF